MPSSMLRTLAAAGIAAAALSITPLAASAEGQSCFFSNQWQGWKATPDASAMYIRVSNGVYRLDLTSPCTELNSPGAYLITNVRGSNSICSPLDIDMKVATSPGFSSACLVRKMTRLSDAERAALPKSLQP